MNNIYLVWDGQPDEDRHEFLSYNTTYTDGFDEKPKTISEVTLDQIINLLEDYMEYSSFQGASTKLSKILLERVGHEKAKEIMWEIARFGGLDELGMS